MTSNGQAGNGGKVVRAAAGVWLIIGLVVLAAIVAGAVAVARSSSAAATADQPTTYQSGRTQREDTFWAAYQASTDIHTKLSRTNAISQADQMCTQEGANPGGVLAYAQSRHLDAAALAEVTAMLGLAKNLC
jgi:hypothetical protein